MPNGRLWHCTGDQRPLICRIGNISPSEEPLGAEAFDQVAGEGLGRVEAFGDGLHIVFCERKVLGQSLRVKLIRACTKRAPPPGQGWRE